MRLAKAFFLFFLTFSSMAVECPFKIEKNILTNTATGKENKFDFSSDTMNGGYYIDNSLDVCSLNYFSKDNASEYFYKFILKNNKLDRVLFSGVDSTMVDGKVSSVYLNFYKGESNDLVDVDIQREIKKINSLNIQSTSDDHVLGFDAYKENIVKIPSNKESIYVYIVNGDRDSIVEHGVCLSCSDNLIEDGFIFGRIGKPNVKNINSGLFKMWLSKKDTLVSGYYYYISHASAGQKIYLSGSMSGDLIHLNESYAGKITGTFDGKYNDEYKTIYGIWTSDNGKKIPFIAGKSIF